MPKSLNDVWSATGFAQVIKVKKRYQARLQVPGDRPGGERKRRQYSLPCTFDEAESALSAAVYLAWVKAHDHPTWEDGIPPTMTRDGDKESFYGISEGEGLAVVALRGPLGGAC